MGDPFGSDGAGYDPGLIPPVQVGFEGALICVEVDANGLPFLQNDQSPDVLRFHDLAGVHDRGIIWDAPNRR